MMETMMGGADLRGSTLLDACALDGLAMQPSADPAAYFVGEIDSMVSQRPGLGSPQPSQELMLGDLDQEDLMLPEPPAAAGQPAAALQPMRPSASWESFPSIPEHSELQLQAVGMGQGGLGNPYGGVAAHAAPLATQPLFVPLLGGLPSKLYLPNSPISSVDRSLAGFSGGTSPDSSPSYQAALGASHRFPRIASMPNLAASGYTNAHPAAASGAGPSCAAGSPGSGTKGGAEDDLRRRAAANRSRGMPRSRSAGDVTDLSRYVVPHSEFLTPPHLRKGKGGRQPAIDPRTDPRIDPKKARRILANRLSAAKSKLKQKSAADGLRQRLEMLRLQREGLAAEVTTLSEACTAQEEERAALRRQLQAAREQVQVQGGAVAEAEAGGSPLGGSLPRASGVLA